MNIEFDSEPVYGDKDKYRKTRKIHMKINTNFQGKKIPKGNWYEYLSLILLDSVTRVNKN